MRLISVALAVAALAFAMPASADPAPDADWNLLERQGNGGIAAILHHLTRNECEFAKARLRGDPATVEEKARQHAWFATLDQRRAAWLAEHPGCKLDLNRLIEDGVQQGVGDGDCTWNDGPPPFMAGRNFTGTDVVDGECFQ